VLIFLVKRSINNFILDVEKYHSNGEYGGRGAHVLIKTPTR